MFVFPSEVRKVFAAVEAAGGSAFVVGGAVRDSLRGVEPKDFDVEVYGLTAEALVAALSTVGRVDAVGASFGVLKVRVGEVDVDVSLPRRDSKVGEGHKGFVVEADPTMTPVEAASRRDFTVNSMMVDSKGCVVDHFGGEADLRACVLRPTSSAFEEDPLRVLRGFQFASRFGMVAPSETAERCRAMVGEFPTLAVERVWGEWDKWATKGVKPSLGLWFLRVTRWLEHFPEAAFLIAVPQEASWHPEGDAFQHTCAVVDAAARIAERDGLDEEKRRVLMFAALCHDFGKPATTKFERGKIRSIGHCRAGVLPARMFLTRIGAPLAVVKAVVALVERHLAHLDFVKHGSSERVVRRLALALSEAGTDMVMLGRVVEADHSGRPPLAGGMPSDMAAMLEVAERLEVADKAPKPVLMGRHLLEARVCQPGPLMGEVLRHVFQRQLDGEVSTLDEAMTAAMQFIHGA